MRGIIQDDTWFCWIAGLDEDDDWEDEANWIKANPALGTMVKIEETEDSGCQSQRIPWFAECFLTASVECLDLTAHLMDADGRMGRPCHSFCP